jgi:hypothetical protein
VAVALCHFHFYFEKKVKKIDVSNIDTIVELAKNDNIPMERKPA